MDRRLFHNARDGLDVQKETGYLFSVAGGDGEPPTLLRDTLFLISHTMERWNRNRLGTLAMLQRDVRLKAMAAELGVLDKAG